MSKISAIDVKNAIISITKIEEEDYIDKYEEELSNSPSLEIISATFKEIAGLNNKYADIRNASVNVCQHQ